MNTTMNQMQLSLFLENIPQPNYSDFAITHVFDAPQKKDIVRLNTKVKKFVNENGWLSKDQAQAKIKLWKNHVDDQYFQPFSRSYNNQKVVLSLFDLSSAWSQPWADAGYQVFRFDIQDNPEIGNVNKFSIEFFNDIFASFDGLDIYAILAACPCTDFAVSGAKHFAKKDADGRTELSIELVKQTLRLLNTLSLQYGQLRILWVALKSLQA